tara:strand:- start:239 stop:1312 length:1074 start_codon:yes stop_codon:yes gene_type:complete
MQLKGAALQPVVESPVKEVDGLSRLHAAVDTNAVTNPLFDADVNYPIGHQWNGTTGESNGLLPAGKWGFCSPLTTNTITYQSFFGYGWLSNYRPYIDSAKFSGEEIGGYQIANIKYSGGRVFKMYGVGASLIDRNRNPDRTEATYPGITSFTSSNKTVNETTTWGDSDCWAKYELMQQVQLPSNAASYTFGALVRCLPNDKLRDLNFGGIYVNHDHSPVSQTDSHINCIAIKRASHNLSLRTGVIPTSQTPFNWSGLRPVVNPTTNIYEVMPNLPGASAVDVEGITYKDAEEFGDFKLVTATGSVSSSYNAIGLGLFFAENHSYLHETPPDPNPPSGSIQFYSPFIQFYNNNGDLIT